MERILKTMFYLSMIIFTSFLYNCNSEKDSDSITERKVLFYSNRDGNTQIYAVNQDGSNIENLSNTSTDDLIPVCSPDGNKIAYESGSRDIFIMDLNGNSKIQITNNNRYNHSPLWSPDGNKIIFCSYAINDLNDRKFHIINLITMAEIIINKALYTYTWSPDSKKIAYAENSQIYTMDPDGTNIVSLFDIGLTIDTIKWSPEGTRILINTYTVVADDIYIINSDGTDLIKIITDISNESRPAWSPDGSRIAFFSDRTGLRGLYIMDADGLDSKLLSSPVGYSFAWSHDGEKIAFASSKDGNPEIYVIDIDNLNTVNVSNSSSIEFSPSW
jgi:TolB protein